MSEWMRMRRENEITKNTPGAFGIVKVISDVYLVFDIERGEVRYTVWIGNNKNPYGRKEMKTSYLSLQRDVSDEVTDARGLTGKF